MSSRPSCYDRIEDYDLDRALIHSITFDGATLICTPHEVLREATAEKH